MLVDAVIMAKSSMFGKFCFAGINIESGEWLRFISYEDGSPLADFQLMYENAPGSSNPLDVARINITGYKPRNNHTEDFTIKLSLLQKIDRWTLKDVLEIHPAENSIHKFIFGNDKDFIHESEFQSYGFDYSLILIRVEELEIYFEEKFKSNELRGRADFLYNGVRYRNIRVTDPLYEFLFSTPKNFRVKFSEAHLVMSMPVKPFKRNGKYYKLIAKIFA